MLGEHYFLLFFFRLVVHITCQRLLEFLCEDMSFNCLTHTWWMNKFTAELERVVLTPFPASFPTQAASQGQMGSRAVLNHQAPGARNIVGARTHLLVPESPGY